MDVKELEAKIAALTEKLAASESKKAEFAKETSEQKVKILEQTQEIENLNIKLSEIETKIQEETKRHSDALAELKSSIDKLTENIAIKEGEVTKITSERDIFCDQNTQLKTLLKEQLVERAIGLKIAHNLISVDESVEYRKKLSDRSIESISDTIEDLSAISKRTIVVEEAEDPTKGATPPTPTEKHDEPNPQVEDFRVLIEQLKQNK